MNSRNHHMFSSVSAHLVAMAGVDQRDESVAFSDVVLRAGRFVGLSRANVGVRSVRGEVGIDWSVAGGRQCGVAAEGRDVELSCGEGGGVISDVEFASYGTAFGWCGSFGRSKCDASSSAEVVRAACVGKASCVVGASNSLFGDPCVGTSKKLVASVKCSGDAVMRARAEVPATAVGAVELGLAGLSDVVVTEGGVVVWKDGAFVTGVDGVRGGDVLGSDVLSFAVVSGVYNFEVRGDAARVVTVNASEGGVAVLECPSGRVMGFEFVGWGTPEFDGVGRWVQGECRSGRALRVAEGRCAGLRLCDVSADTALLGEPCFGTKKQLVLSARCGEV